MNKGVILATALIPHAHEKYAGSVQKKVVQLLKNLERKYASPQQTKDVQVFFVPACHSQCMRGSQDSDHSIDYVMPLLEKYFTNVSVMNHPIPHSTRSLNTVVKQIQTEIKNKNTTKAIIIGTVDLSHHLYKGKPWPRLKKVRDEEYTIKELCTLRNPFQLASDLIDAPYSVRVAQHFSPVKQGVVVAYNDSASAMGYGSEFDLTIKEMPSFVSYVGILFSKDPDILRAAEKYAIRWMAESVKNTVYHSFHKTGQTDQTAAPSWLLLSHVPGLWAGLSCKKKTKCSVGRISINRGDSRPKALMGVASKCIDDADNRWGGLNSLEECEYKYETLSRLKPVPWKDRKRLLNPTTTGIFLWLKSGQSATYLPGVWKEHWPQKDVDYVLEQLAQKASRGASLQSIDKNKLYLYTTKAYYVK